MLEVVKWVSNDEAEKLSCSFGGMGGFFNDGMRWKDFLDAFIPESHQYAEALRRDIIKRRIKECGLWHQENENGVPVFSDGTVAMFSFRAWGDLLAAIWSTEENRDSNYLEFYC